VIDSRRGDSRTPVMEMTSGRGVDIVLNALAGEAIPMGLSCLAEFGPLHRNRQTGHLPECPDPALAAAAQRFLSRRRHGWGVLLGMKH